MHVCDCSFSSTHSPKRSRQAASESQDPGGEGGHFPAFFITAGHCTGVRYYVAQSPIWTVTSEDRGVIKQSVVL